MKGGKHRMHYGIRCSSLSLLAALVLCFGASLCAQIRYEDFSTGKQYLQLNGSASFQMYQGNPVLRLTDGGAGNPEAATVYFHNTSRPPGPIDPAKQQVAGGFTTWFEFQMHNPTACCAPGDGIAFIIQNSSATDPSYGATGIGFKALGAGGNRNYPNQAGALGYAGINNNLVIEFDLVKDAWDPNSNHIAIQTCGPNINTPVHETGDYTIGSNNMVTSCLLSQQSIDTNIPMLRGACNGSSCADGPVHQAVIGYTPPSGNQQGTLQIWLDPTFLSGTHTPTSPPNMNVPYNIVYNSQGNPSGLKLDTARCSGQGPCGYAWVGFTASQPDEGTAQDIFGWEFTLSTPAQIQQVIQPGGTPTVFAFGEHETTVTYPTGFQNPTGILMNVTATPVSRSTFYLTRLFGTKFADEFCVTYLGTGPGRCIVYSYTCQDQHGNPVNCPSETDPTIAVNTTFYTSDNVTANDADYLENDMIGDNNWMSIFTGFQPDPLDGTTSGGTRGFGNSGGSRKPLVVKRSLLTGGVQNADIVATFRPSQQGGK
jgi:legume-like lectin family protein